MPNVVTGIQLVLNQFSFFHCLPLHFQILTKSQSFGIQIVHLQTLSHFVQEAKGKIDDDLCPAPISQDSLDGNAHWVCFFFFFLKPWPLLHLINQLVSMAHLFYKLLLTYHMLSVRHDPGPWGASHPMRKVWLVNKKCHKALQICIEWQMLEADHPHIWKKYGLQHFLNNVFPQISAKVLSIPAPQGTMVSLCCLWTCWAGFLVAWWVPLLLCLHGRRFCRSWGPASPCVTYVNGITLCKSGLEEGTNQPVRRGQGWGLGTIWWTECTTFLLMVPEGNAALPADRAGNEWPADSCFHTVHQV